MLDEAAVEAWARYLEVETQSNWREEAKLHLERLKQPTSRDGWDALSPQLLDLPDESLDDLSRRFVFEVREMFLREYLKEWSAEPFDETLCANVDRWVEIGREHRLVTGDPLVHDSAEWLTTSLCDAKRSGATVRALGQTVEGIELYERSDSARSLKLLQRARPELESQESPLVDVIDLYSAINIFALNRYAEADQRLEELEMQFGSRDLHFLAARAAWLQGTIALRNQDLAGAVEHYRRAEARFDAISDLSHRAAIRGLLAETLGRMGLFRDAWTSGLEGLRLARTLGRERRLYSSCSLLGIVAALEGVYGLAAEYQKCAAEHVNALANYASATDVHLWQAVWLHRGGRKKEAIKSLQEAQSLARQIPDAEEQEQAWADLALVEGALKLTAMPRLALDRLGRAIEFFDRIEHYYYASDARLLQASAAQQTGDQELAEESLLEALRLHESFRVGDSNPGSRLAVLHNNHSIYDRLVRLYLDTEDDSWLSLFFSDRGKEDRFQPEDQLSDASLQREAEHTVSEWSQALDSLPGSVTIASYHLLTDEVVTWILRPNHEPSLHRVGLGASVPAVGRDRFWIDVLSESLEGQLVPDGTLVVIPDKGLAGIPVALLLSELGRDRTATEMAVLSATSLSDFLMSTPTGSLAEPLHAVKAFLAPQPPLITASLPSLRPSREEAEVLSRSFRQAEIWEAVEATRERFLSSLTSPGVLHFSGHAIVDDERPLESSLYLSAGMPGSDGRVTALNLYAVDEYRVQLVTLAGCSTSAAPSLLPMSLALVRPFLTRGVPAVLGSLKPLPDDLFVDFATAFYSELERSQSVLSAFRNAQRSLRADAQPTDFRWAEIQLYGTKHVLESRRKDV